MDCPNCHTLCGDSDFFCYACGAPLRQKNTPKKGSRFIPALILILISVFGLILFFATAGRGTESSDADCFKLYEGTLYFDGSRYTGGSELTVPAEVGGSKVRRLSEGCFAGSTALTTVILPDTLTSVGDRAFADCSCLRGIYIPSSVRSIGAEAFAGCTQLEAIYLHNSLKTISNDAFDRCGKLNYIYFDGTCKQWQKLYNGQINDQVGVFCKDGSFYQGQITN